MLKTYVATPSTIERKWWLIDAENLVVGRLSSIVANLLRGKHKPTFTPNIDSSSRNSDSRKQKENLCKGWVIATALFATFHVPKTCDAYSNMYWTHNTCVILAYSYKPLENTIATRTDDSTTLKISRLVGKTSSGRT